MEIIKKMEKMEYNLPEKIEKRSFELILEELNEKHAGAFSRVAPELAPLLLRVIHSTADFSWVETIRASGGAVRDAVAALRAGASIVTDTKMAAAGIDKERLFRSGGGKTFCFIADDDVAALAKQNGTTRAVAAVEKAAGIFDGKTAPVFAVGNAPTALFRLCELAENGKLKPALVIGVPVGFVNVVESKERLLQSGLPYITAPGRKGGSTVAAAICNSLLRLADGPDESD
jgi:precorrin-8X/cobalt-precorrin-8 methylmutase